jgi:hypothetical protein
MEETKMVEQSETYQWECTLADDSVVKESEGASFDLAWEADGAVKLFELKQEGGSKVYSINLETGEFNKDGETDTPNAGSLGDFGLRFFRRNVIRVDHTGPLGAKVAYFIGYKKGGDEKLLKVAPAIGQVEADVDYAER